MDHSYKDDSLINDKEKTGKSKFKILILVLVLVVVAGVAAVFLLFFGGMGIFGSTDPESSLTSDKFYNGIFVDDISLGGLSRDQAKQQVEAKQKQNAASTGVTVTDGAQNWKYNLTDISYTYDTDSVLAQAWNIGRTGTDKERRATIKQLGTSPVKLATTMTADPSSLEQKVRALAATFTVAPVNASFAGYDVTKPDGQRLNFTPDTPGSQVDADSLWASVKKQFDDKTFGIVQIQKVPVDAQVKLSELQADMQLVCRFKTYLKDHSKPRYTNVSLASAAISGQFILPGDTFSFNDTTGERTALKGYQMAHVINGGVVDNGLAGGTCQVSGTLFNALARADLDIVERDAHSLRSGYLPLGEDATVDYGHYDLKVKNSKATPVLIILYLGQGDTKNYLFAEIYGTPIPNGQTIGLDSVVTDTIHAPDTTTYSPSTAVTRGTTETMKAHDGLKVTTYKVYYKDKVEVNRVPLYQSYYKEAGVIICYNPADGLPTPTPELTPTPSSTPVPLTLPPLPTPTQTIAIIPAG